MGRALSSILKSFCWAHRLTRLCGLRPFLPVPKLRFGNHFFSAKLGFASFMTGKIEFYGMLAKQD
jgi:hypothetical protein